MSDFKSAIVTRQGEILEHWNTDSHEDLVNLFNLRDRKDFFVRVEFRPEDSRDLIDIDKYILRVDEESIPAWFEEYREATQKRLTEIVSRIIRKDYVSAILVEGAYILSGKSKIGKNLGRIISLNGGIVNLVGNGGSVNLVGNGGIVDEVWNGGSVNLVGNGGSVNLVGNGGSVNLVWDGGSVNEVRNGGSVDEVGNGGSVNVVCNGGSVNLVGNGGIVDEVWNGGIVNLVGNGGSVNLVWDGGIVNEVWNGGIIKNDCRTVKK